MQFKIKNLMFLCSFFSFAFVTLSTLAQNASFPNLSKLEKNGCLVSALVVRLNDGKILADLNSEKRLSPASVTKLILGAHVLETWGPNKTFSTQFYMRGKLNKDTLEGDLVFYGVGDPSLTNEKLWFLTTDVARYGIKKVTGKIIINNSYYGKVTEDENRLAGKTKSRNAYDAPLSSSAINFSVLAIVVSPAQKEGLPAKIAVEPYSIPSVNLVGSVTTSKEGSNPQITVSRISKNGKDIYSVSGNVPLKSTAERVYRSVSNADIYAGETLNAYLQKSGIETSGVIGFESKALNKTDIPIAEIKGYPIEWQLKGLFEVSNNYTADMLTLKLLNESENPKNKGNLKEGGALLENYMKNILKSSAWETSKNTNSPLILESGSGLTPNNRLSARDIISVLDHMFFNGRAFPAYINALPIVGDEGTLKKRFTSSSEKHLQGRLRGKTGTLTEPVHVSALGGYSRLSNGDFVSFAILVNGIKSKAQIDLKNIRDAIDSDLAKVLPSEL